MATAAQATSTTAAIEYSFAYGNKWYLTTDLQLVGRGIKESGNGSDHARGKRTYYATAAAFDKLKQQYKCLYAGD